MSEERMFRLTVKGDNTLKTFFERFYVIPKDGMEWKSYEQSFLERNRLVLTNEKTAKGENGYLVFTKEKILTPDIKSSHSYICEYIFII